MDLKINDAAVKKLELKTDTELAKSFLVKKNKTLINYDVITDESLTIREMRKKDQTVKYPYYCSLQAIERAYFLTHILDKYYLLVHDPKKYDLKLESLIALYDSLLADNWTTFDRERIKAEQEAKKEGLEKRNFTTQFNADLCDKVYEVVRNIDLSKTSSLEI